MKQGLVGIVLGIALLCVVPFIEAQQSLSANANTVVPTLVKFSGTLTDINGEPLIGVTGVTFLLYKDEQAGAPLWMETQNITPDKSGHYTVVLGTTIAQGLPTDLFASGEARWLGVQVEGQAEQPRVLLLSVPYALKAGDAQTLGGFPASAFALVAPVSQSVNNAQSLPELSPSSTLNLSAAPPATNVTGAGTVDFIPLWTTTSNIGNSALFQSGSGTSAKIGISTTTPAATLDVKGTANLEGLLTLPATGTATTSGGKISQAQDFVASSFNSGTTAAVNQTFQWRAEPTGNNTASPSGTLNLLFGSGTTAPAETGLRLSNTGLFTFATGQKFPGAGSITGVTTATGSGLSGGGTTGTLSLSLLKSCAANQTLQWNGTNWICATISGGGTITGVTAGTDLTGGGTTGKVTLNLDTTKVPLLATNNIFSGTQTINSSMSVTSNNSLAAFNLTDTSSGNGIQAFANNSSGYAIYGANSGSGTGVGASSSGMNGTGVYATAQGIQGTGVFGSASAAGGIGMHGLSSSSSSVGSGTVNTGVWGDTTSGNGVTGTTDTGIGIVAASRSGQGLYGISSSSDGVFGTSATGAGVSAYSSSFVGTYSEYFIPSASGSGFGGTGIWGDTGETGSIGVLGTADDGNAIFGKNNTFNHETLYVENDANFSVAARFAGSGSATWCEILQDLANNTGDLMCTGSKSAAVPVDGNRMVRLYAVEAADNWFEDAGSAQLVDGKGSVVFDHVFAQTINGDVDYHVFLTPNGECDGLYIASKGAQGFEVREPHGGHSNISFDYRIMARRKGFENVRMEDVTAHFELAKHNAEQRAALLEANKAQHKTPLQNHQPPIHLKTASPTASVAEPASAKFSLPTP